MMSDDSVQSALRSWVDQDALALVDVVEHQDDAGLAAIAVG